MFKIHNLIEFNDWSKLSYVYNRILIIIYIIAVGRTYAISRHTLSRGAPIEMPHETVFLNHGWF